MSEMNEPELLPCPFCGGKPKEFTRLDDNSIMCSNCYIEKYGRTHDAVVQKWNRRVPAVGQWTTEPPKEEGWYMVCYDNIHVDCIQLELRKIRLASDVLGTYIDTGLDFDERYEFYTIKQYVDRFGVSGWCKIEFPPLPEWKESDE